ncbi:MAG: S8 family serine peptidase [Candidatus Edwardsbacteria bacterium]
MMKQNTKSSLALFFGLIILALTMPCFGQETLAMGKRKKQASEKPISDRARKWLNPISEERRKKEEKEFAKFAAVFWGSYKKVGDKSFKIVRPSDEYKKEDILYDLEVSFVRDISKDTAIAILQRHSLEIYHFREVDNKVFVKIPDLRTYRQVIIELAEENDILYASPNWYLGIDAKPRNDLLYVSKVLEITVKPNVTPVDVDSICLQYNLRMLYRMTEKMTRGDVESYRGPEYFRRRYTLEILDEESTIKKEAILMKDPRIQMLGTETMGPVILDSMVEPNDPRFSEQWYLKNVGLPWVWALGTGDVNDTIAILDIGFRLSHQDLSGRSIDAYDWVNMDFTPEEIITIAEPYGHGTVVAGIVGAMSNNSKDITGVTWNTTMMLYKVLWDSCSIVTWDNPSVVSALYWAVDYGASAL